MADVLQYAGITAFAISGALIGVRKRLDLLGVLVVGAATGVGGGILRDLLLGITPPVSLVHWPNLAVALSASLLVFFFHPKISKIRYFEVVFDAFGLGLFAATTAVAALEADHTILTAVIVGVMTAIGGGVVRDVLVNSVPGVLTRELYAVSALFGALVAALLWEFTNLEVLAATIGTICGVGLRLLSYWREWELPMPHGVERERLVD